MYPSSSKTREPSGHISQGRFGELRSINKKQRIFLPFSFLCRHDDSSKPNAQARGISKEWRMMYHRHTSEGGQTSRKWSFLMFFVVVQAACKMLPKISLRSHSDGDWMMILLVQLNKLLARYLTSSEQPR